MTDRPVTASEQKAKAAEIAAELPLVEPPATNVIAAIRRVMRDLPGIGKDQQASAQQGGYSYRGIEQISRHTQGLFAKHGVVFTPHVESWEIRELVVNGKPWTDTVILVSYSVFGPGGTEDRITVGPILGIGRDNSDKGANKALTQTFKYALLQALSISDAKDDNDGITHEADAAPPPAPLEPPEWQAVRSDLAELPAEVRDRLVADAEARSGGDLAGVLADDGWRKWLTDAIATHKASEPTQEATA